MRGSELIKIGVGTGAGKSITYGKSIPGDSDLTFRTATGDLFKSGKRVQVAGFATIGERISEFELFKHRCANHCCLLENTRRWAVSL